MAKQSLLLRTITVYREIERMELYIHITVTFIFNFKLVLSFFLVDYLVA